MVPAARMDGPQAGVLNVPRGPDGGAKMNKLHISGRSPPAFAAMIQINIARFYLAKLQRCAKMEFR